MTMRPRSAGRRAVRDQDAHMSLVYGRGSGNAWIPGASSARRRQAGSCQKGRQHRLCGSRTSVLMEPERRLWQPHPTIGHLTLLQHDFRV